MNHVVIDASALIAVIANEPVKHQLAQVTQDAVLIAPHSVHWEIGNAFSAMLKRQRATLAQVVQAVAVYQTIPIRFVEIELAEALQLAHELNLYAYDAYLLRCAIKYSAPLLSLDRGLIHAAQALNAPIIEVTA
ncbi:MAG: type II toxin-antitoxin system VapC family toxin [Ardenticatenaceae bacterium]|nr:type II toxin-antitoxin system VapC family toxin [Ardenticatenaceae bacterium]